MRLSIIVLSKSRHLYVDKSDSLLPATLLRLLCLLNPFGGTVPLIILMTLLLLSSWFFSEVLVLVPLNILNSLKPFSSLTLVVVFLGFLWCFGE
jgi:hypothetical protein